MRSFNIFTLSLKSVSSWSSVAAGTTGAGTAVFPSLAGTPLDEEVFVVANTGSATMEPRLSAWATNCNGDAPNAGEVVFAGIWVGDPGGVLKATIGLDEKVGQTGDAQGTLGLGDCAAGEEEEDEDE